MSASGVAIPPDLAEAINTVDVLVDVVLYLAS